MNLDTHNRVLGVPVFHAIGLACWSMFHPRDSWTPLLLWGLWIPLIWLGFSRRTLLIAAAGSAPFLLMHAFYRG